ncbi:hypothetical protein HB943_14845 [Listeria weihenstephanensis]|uniref:Thioredoxin domain-containing protein n=1 Tax=Listeria weihenstephanensis TaxID=1006155 RepID=A0A841ZBI6_9LIST|nr:hypothetical protein [Listeria weihenstephanensis]MBC1501876.1 hypothetical protein [Listeria weihenstephanensis]
MINNVVKVLLLVAVLVFSLVACHSETSKSGEIVPIEKSAAVLDLFKDNDSKEVKYIYFGRETCDFCKKLTTDLKDTLKKKDVSILYYDTDKHRLDKDFQNVIEKYQLVEVPYLVKMKQGIILDTMKSDGDLNQFLDE